MMIGSRTAKKLLSNRSATFAPLRAQVASKSTQGHWTNLETVGLDSIKQLTVRFQQDPSPKKVLLGEGVYRDDNGKPVILKSVREAEKRIYEKNMDHEYAPVPGVAAFCDHTRVFAFGDQSSALKDQRIATVQTLSGTGGLRLAAEFLRKFTPNATPVYFPNPTWVNHPNIFRSAGFTDVRYYKYFCSKSNGMAVDGCLEDIRAAPQKSIIVLHACAHNPTGVDPTMDTWKKISEICKERNHIVFFDNAYQGFASGDPAQDAQSFRYFVEQGHMPLVVQSYAKNFGLYGERVGALNVVCETKNEATAVHSQLQILIRASYSNPPVYGARLVSTVLSDPALKSQWEQDVKEMSHRIRAMREGLVSRIVKAGSTKPWNHITDQIGMFAFSGLSSDQVARLIAEYNVYMTSDGRMSISGLNTKNLDYVAQAVHNVTK